MKFRNYVLLLLSLFIVLSGLTVSFNYLVDPFLVFGSKRVDGFNAIKASINSRTWLMKTYHPAVDNWTALLLGNSRVEIGFDPQHRCLTDVGAKTYNLGVPGANVQEQLAFAANVIYQQPIREIFLSVDYSDFLTKLGTVPQERDSGTGTNLHYLVDGSENSDYRWNLAKDRYRALYTLDALSSSLRTVATQRATSPDRNAFGFNPARDFADSVDAEGAYALFAQKIDNLDSKYSVRWSLLQQDGSPSAAFSSLQRLLDIAREREIRVTVFASPFHIEYWNILKKHGLYEQHRLWLKDLTDQLSEYEGIVEFWDFTAAPEFSQETVPDAGVLSGPLRWYWEPVHFRSELGDLVLETVLSDRCEQAEAHFGVQVL